jgi:hypothetical protein
MEDLIPPGAKPGTIPTDLEQATGLERLEILGKMQGIDIFDMRPLPSDRRGMFGHLENDVKGRSLCGYNRNIRGPHRCQLGWRGAAVRLYGLAG